jgi:hypothetical protein
MTKRKSEHQTKVSNPTFKVKAKVWLYAGIGGWHFVTLPVKQSLMIRALYSNKSRSFGSIAVSVTIGKTQWKTSLFPDKKSNSYLFAIKAEVRKKENISADDTITAEVQIL